MRHERQYKWYELDIPKQLARETRGQLLVVNKWFSFQVREQKKLKMTKIKNGMKACWSFLNSTMTSSGRITELFALRNGGC